MIDERNTDNADKQTKQTPVRILDAAERIFAKSGYSGASTRTIADAANANIGLIAYYFSSKEGLFEAVVARRAEGLTQRVNHSNNQTGDSSSHLSRFLVGSATYLAKEHPEFLVIAVRESLGSEASPLSEVVSAHLTPHRERLAAVLRAGIRDGSVRSTDPSVFYAAMMGALAAAAGSPSLASGPSPNGIKETVELLVAGVLRAPATRALSHTGATAEPDPPPPQPVSTTDQQDKDFFEIGMID